MTLINSILAFGALAFTVPLAIHLLFRSRFRTVDWGAMHLLDSIIQVNRRRMQWLQLLLLLLRCLIPVLLAFCLARPLLTGFQSLPGNAPQSLVIAIDDSRSMQARSEVGGPRLDQVRSELTELVEALSRSDEIMLVRASRLNESAASMGRQEAIGELKQLDANAGPVSIEKLLGAAVEAADQASHPQRRIILVSDFQAVTAVDSTQGTVTRLSRDLAGRSLRPVISFLDVGGGVANEGNVAVRRIVQQAPTLVAGRTARFVAELTNDSDRDVSDARLVWSIDGQPLRPSTVSLPSHSTITTALSQTVQEVGTHELAVAVEHEDVLPADNRRAIGIDVIEEVNVLLVDGQIRRQPLASETDFLAIALSPFAFGGDDQPDAVQTRRISVSQLAEALSDKRPDVVVLANVASIGDDARRLLGEYVHRGGSMVVFDGDQVSPSRWNVVWHDQWSLPARLGELVGDTESTEARYSIAFHNRAYAPWDVLGDRDSSPFAEVVIRKYRQLRLRADDADNSAADSDPTSIMTLLRFGNGDPAAVMASVGRGRVVQFAIAADAEWTNLPAQLVYLPMMQQLMLDLAGSRNKVTLQVGESLSVPVDTFRWRRPPQASVDGEDVSYTLQRPGGAEVPVEPTGTSPARLVVPSLQQPGVYRLRQTIAVPDEAPIRNTVLRVVDVPPEESDLRTLPESRVKAIANLVDAKIYRSRDSLQQDDRTRRFGREIWRWLLVALLLVMLAELFVQQRKMTFSPAGAT